MIILIIVEILILTIIFRSGGYNDPVCQVKIVLNYRIFLPLTQLNSTYLLGSKRGGKVKKKSSTFKITLGWSVENKTIVIEPIDMLFAQRKSPTGQTAQLKYSIAGGQTGDCSSLRVEVGRHCGRV